VSGAARAKPDDVASAPAALAADDPMKWRRLMSMTASFCGNVHSVSDAGVTQKSVMRRGGKAVIDSRVNPLHCSSFSIRASYWSYECLLSSVEMQLRVGIIFFLA
jgi:hypothetical protein